MPSLYAALILYVSTSALQLGVLLVPAAAQLLEAGEPVAPRLVVRREPARVRPHGVPGRAELDGDHPGRGVVQQLPVVADEQDRLRRLPDPALEPDLAGYVEEVVRLVEQQHLVGPGEQVLQHQPLLLATAERVEVAVLRLLEADAESGRATGVPDDLDLVAAGVGELRERRRVGHLGRLVVDVHQLQLESLDLGGGRPHPRRRDREQQLGHDASSPGRPSAASRRDRRTRVTAPACGASSPVMIRSSVVLPAPLAPTSATLAPVADAEGHVVEQHPSVGQLVAHSGYLHMAHGAHSPAAGVPTANGLLPGEDRARASVTCRTMSQQTRADETSAPRWRLIGPGLVVAATGVGAADLVATLIAGSKYGYLLLWCAVVGCVMKIVLVEGAGRYSLATGRTIFEGWRSLGIWTTWYFAPVHRGLGLRLRRRRDGRHRARPRTRCSAGLSVTWWGILSGLIGLALVWSGRYGMFEKVLAALVGLMFVTMVGAAAGHAAQPARAAERPGPAHPRRRAGQHAGLAGGVGGTITLAAYGYWLREKGWNTPRLHAGDADRQRGRVRRHRHLRRRHADRRRGAALLRQHRRVDG